MNPFESYFHRYRSLRGEFDASLANETLFSLLERPSSQLNNLMMAGLGMGTLFLRMGAVVQMCKKLHDGDTSNDALFLKQVVENLRETLPSDTNWKNLWMVCVENGSDWEKPILRQGGKTPLLDRFVTFRNRFVHQSIRLTAEHEKQILEALAILEEMAELHSLFEESLILRREDRYYWTKDGLELDLHPFVQDGEHEGLPYLFQGLYDNRSRAKFINTLYGDETQPLSNPAIDATFDPMRRTLSAGAGQLFDHSDRIRYYLDCFVGRERELDQVLRWVMDPDAANMLPIYSEAGMGKGALSAGIVDALQKAEIPVMYHFCGSGMQNSLHAVLYHFILMGKTMPGMNGASIWKIDDELLQRKLERLPSRYYDAIALFQGLLDECYEPPQRYKDKPLVILIDCLDEAAVANLQLTISDWFYRYNDKDEIEDEWVSPAFVKWIVTYRSLPDGKQGGFRLDGRFTLAEASLIQPIQGLNEAAVRQALKEFNVSEDFLQAVMERGAVS